MNKIISYCGILLIIIFTHSVYAYSIYKGECYSIDGPANVRTTPKGKTLESLKNGTIVKVIDIKNKWYLIEYSTNKFKSNCSFTGNTTKAWTYYKNILLPTTKLMNLTSSGKIIVSTSEIDLSGQKSTDFLGEKYNIECNDSKEEQCYLKIPQPFEISEYCLNGKNQRNRIRKVYIEYGGDAHKWLTDIKYEQPLLKGNCIVVNGTIASHQYNTKAETNVKYMNICTYCEKRIADYNSRYKANYECVKHVGDFNKDGNKEALIHLTQLDGAPTIENYDLFEIKEKCQAVHIGNIHHVVIP